METRSAGCAKMWKAVNAPVCGGDGVDSDLPLLSEECIAAANVSGSVSEDAGIQEAAAGETHGASAGPTPPTIPATNVKTQKLASRSHAGQLSGSFGSSDG